MKEEYQKLQKKYSKLPDFDKLNSYFDIYDADCNGFFLRNIKKKIAEKMAGFCDILEGVLQPESGLAAMHESKYVGEKERELAVDIYMAFMKINRLALELSVEEDDAKNAEFIKTAYDSYGAKSAGLKQVMAFLKGTWEKKDAAGVKEEIEYLR